MSDGLTPAQFDVLDFMARHIVEKQRPPTRGDISAHFGWSSVNAADTHVQALERKGFIVCDGSATGSHWQRYPRIVRWPDNVLPIIQLAAVPETAKG